MSDSSKSHTYIAIPSLALALFLFICQQLSATSRRRRRIDYAESRSPLLVSVHRRHLLLLLFHIEQRELPCTWTVVNTRTGPSLRPPSDQRSCCAHPHSLLTPVASLTFSYTPNCPTFWLSVKTFPPFWPFTSSRIHNKKLLQRGEEIYVVACFDFQIFLEKLLWLFKCCVSEQLSPSARSLFIDHVYWTNKQTNKQIPKGKSKI